MDQYGKITVVLSWDPCHRGPPLHASPRKPAGTARVIVSGVGESTTQRHQDIHTSHAQLSATPSISSTGVGGAPSAVTPQTVVHGTITTILRDGKKETLINDVGSSVHQSTVINHDSEQKTTFIGRLSRQGSSVESGHSAIHIHTPECCTRGHPTPVPPTRASPTGEPQECDFHCRTLHEDGGRLQPKERHHHHGHQSSQQVLQQLSPLTIEQQVQTPKSPQHLHSPMTHTPSPHSQQLISSHPHQASSSSKQQQSSQQQLPTPQPPHTPQAYSPLALQAKQKTASSLQVPSQHTSSRQKSKDSQLTPTYAKPPPSPTVRVQIHSQAGLYTSYQQESQQQKQSHDTMPRIEKHHGHKSESSKKHSLTAQQKQQHLQQLQQQLHQQQLELQQIEIQHQKQLHQQTQQQQKSNKCRIHDQPCNCC